MKTRVKPFFHIEQSNVGSLGLRRDERAKPLLFLSQRIKVLLFGLCFSHLLPAFAAQPQGEPPMRLDWWSLDAGGGQSTGGEFTLSGSLGQPDAGAQSGGDYVLVGGFWGFLFQTPQPAADLRITRTGGDVMVSWPGGATGFRLEETVSLAPAPISWNGVPQTPILLNGEYTVTVPAGPGAKFYRLRKP